MQQEKTKNAKIELIGALLLGVFLGMIMLKGIQHGYQEWTSVTPYELKQILLRAHQADNVYTCEFACYETILPDGQRACPFKIALTDDTSTYIYLNDWDEGGFVIKQTSFRNSTDTLVMRDSDLDGQVDMGLIRFVSEDGTCHREEPLFARRRELCATCFQYSWEEETVMNWQERYESAIAVLEASLHNNQRS